MSKRVRIAVVVVLTLIGGVVAYRALVRQAERRWKSRLHEAMYEDWSEYFADPRPRPPAFGAPVPGNALEHYRYANRLLQQLAPIRAVWENIILGARTREIGAGDGSLYALLSPEGLLVEKGCAEVRARAFRGEETAATDLLLALDRLWEDLGRRCHATDHRGCLRNRIHVVQCANELLSHREIGAESVARLDGWLRRAASQKRDEAEWLRGTANSLQLAVAAAARGPSGSWGPGILPGLPNFGPADRPSLSEVLDAWEEFRGWTSETVARLEGGEDPSFDLGIEIRGKIGTYSPRVRYYANLDAEHTHTSIYLGQLRALHLCLLAGLEMHRIREQEDREPESVSELLPNGLPGLPGSAGLTLELAPGGTRSVLVLRWTGEAEPLLRVR